MRLARRQFLVSVAAAGLAGQAHAQVGKRPLVFAHRGASALRPEHTLAAYAKAIEDGADFIEPDLVATRDGVLVVRHEPEISETTDVSARPEFAGRRATKDLDGRAVTGWFTEDFSLAELKSLRAKERLGPVRPLSAAYDSQFQVPTFEEVIAFVAAEAAARDRVIGLVPELKHSTYFAKAGLALEDRFLATLAAHEYTRRAPVQVQSFETANLKALRPRLPRGGNVRLVQLIDNPAMRPADDPKGPTYGEMLSPAGLKAIGAYADVLAPNSRIVIPIGADGRLVAPTSVVRDAHAAGMTVCAWTFRPENQFLAADFRDDAGPHARNEAGSVAEMRRYLETGLDAFFTDDPALGVKAVG